MSANYSEAQMDQRAPSIPSGKTCYDPLSPTRNHVGPGHLLWGLWLNLTGQLLYPLLSHADSVNSEFGLWPYMA